METWKSVMSGRYEVSDLGRVKSLVAPGGQKILKPTPHVRSGHGVLILTDQDGGRRGTYVHKVVIEAFVGPCPEGMEVLHDDGDPSNNALSNLRYGTRSENLLDAVRHGTHQHAKKTTCPKGREYDRVRTRRTGPKAGQEFRACSLCENRKDH